MTPEACQQKTRQLVGAVQELNARWASRAISLWRGDGPAANPEAIYSEFDDFLTVDAIDRVADIEDAKTRTRLRHGLIDHYLQRKLMPHETEMQAWSRGAAAHVDGEKILFREVIPWCQKSSTLAKRQKLQQETGPLCKLLKPFAVNYWRIVLETLTKELGFENYIDYCSAKKGLDYRGLYPLAKQLLDQTQEPYSAAMEAWSRERFGICLENLSRFDAIYLLGLSQWDRLCPMTSPEETLIYLRRWGLDPLQYGGLHLDIRQATGKSAQAISVMVNIPGEVYLLMRPEGGWIDVETLWHELGHGLSAVCTDPELNEVDRELATDFSLSEVYAFFLQRLALSAPVLSSAMGLPDETVETIAYYRELKDLSIFRRYAAKFVSEYEMFTGGDIADGRPYAQTMGRYTGFYHQPESHLFDLVPEFYCADYMLGWMGEALLHEYWTGRFGADQYPGPEMGAWLKSLWRQGNRLDIHAFFIQNDLGEVTAEPLVRRWQRLLEKPFPGT
jgi:hypothetical protein